MDVGYLLLVIGGYSVDQVKVGGPGTPPAGWAWSEDHFYVKYVHIGGSWGCGWWLSAPSYWRLWR